MREAKAARDHTTVTPKAGGGRVGRAFAMVLGLGVAQFGCRMSLSPLQNRINVGDEPFVVFVADGENGAGDLFAMRAEGGPVFQVTYTRLDESGPALSPDGMRLAFLRKRAEEDSSEVRVEVMDLASGAERTVLEATAGGSIGAGGIGWSRDGRSLVVATAAGLIRVAQVAEADGPSRAPVPPAERAAADSSLRVFIGDPAFGEVVACRDSPGLCVVPRGGEESSLMSGGYGAFRWGGDSVAYLVGGRVEVRPLDRGRPRLVRWEGSAPSNPRQLTFFPGR